MKMVINGYAGAGTVTDGRLTTTTARAATTGEMRNFRAGRCIGACLEYAARMQKPLMIYVFSDGSLSANGVVEHVGRRPRQARLDQRQPVDRRARSCWSTSPRARPALRDHDTQRRSARSARRRRGDDLVPGRQRGQPAGRDRDPQLHGAARRGRATSRRCSRANGLGGTALRDSLTMFAPVCNGTVTNPV